MFAIGSMPCKNRSKAVSTLKACLLQTTPLMQIVILKVVYYVNSAFPGYIGKVIAGGLSTHPSIVHHQTDSASVPNR